MSLIDVLSPFPRRTPGVYKEFRYPIAEVSYLPIPQRKGSRSFFDVIESRRSQYRFGMLDWEALASLLWHSARTVEIIENQEIQLRRCPAPSAGARHPIDLLILAPGAPYREAFLYLRDAHCLGRLKTPLSARTGLLQDVERCFPVGDGTVICLAAQPGRTESKYEHAESLVWRDAGVLLGQLLLVSEALGLNASAFGVTGEPHVSALFDSRGVVIGVGGCVVGERT